ncbi:gamma-glutamyltransferase [Caulobacter sp. 17J65-9]|uniref:gamma-glutamyltransferase n=1 Tax=Caulobacter sp. 17J65-9 TaxID=2709382 RepID=UPI0013CD5CC3|nr:gamma-glutamyltransferase [Caulobacter sp. 17J65-9]NEX94447.1 gamma-glutamyltransferase [Caulobacter sp. 17J65-9]
MRLVAVLAAALAVSACAQINPFPAEKPAVQAGAAPHEMLVAAANPLAAEAGMDVLKRGGSAVDAAIAIQSVLGLVEPQSSGLGGGAFMLVYDAKSGEITAYDGRETAPAGASPTMFLDEAGKPLPFDQAVISGRSTGAPGVVAMLSAAHGEHGRLAWKDLFGSAEKLADEGFTVSPRLSNFVNGQAPQNARPDVQAYFTEADGTLVETGDTLKNPAYAATLRAIAADPRAFYEGAVASAIAAKVHEGPRPGTLSVADLKGYRPGKGAPVCTHYRVYLVCSAAPPSSGVSLLQALEILERTDVATHGAGDPKGWFLFTQAQRLMYADRDRYVGDPAFVDVPTGGLLDSAYVDSRAALIGERAGPASAPGTPPGAGVRAPDRTREPAGTSHFVVVDREGNVVSMTTSVESLFGSGRMAAGFFLNNQLTDFSFSPTEKDGVPAANAVAPGKRPRSSMSPVIVLDAQGRFVAALGSPGGSNILAYNLKTLLGVLDWNLSMQQAIDLPNVISRGDTTYGEADKLSPEVRAGLVERGVTVQAGRGEGSGLHGVIRRGDRLEGGADKRREGVVLTAQ